MLKIEHFSALCLQGFWDWIKISLVSVRYAGCAMIDPVSARPKVTMGSNRSFGLVFTVVFAVIGLWPLIGGSEPKWSALYVAGAILALALLVPRILYWPNRIWFLFGNLLHRVMSPVTMGVVYVFSVLPLGILFRLLRKDPLRLRWDANADSYWVPRDPPSAYGSMRDQF
ncbi:SxtJ family membrane protein [Niveispirillum irakense]|uniref:SxtJ family membrane protein n=1 Tax=Niveispirillum irakense TaxID=34011 RepID=UPI0012B56DB5|nr:SxtJ family membrane protein [Niveispirillum irakense]